ncbi:MAG: hypothetical protein U0802_16810 [Candidatus Binatia bacterium]
MNIGCGHDDHAGVGTTNAGSDSGAPPRTMATARPGCDGCITRRLQRKEIAW